MKILIIKLSSLGDLIHTFPAITEAMQKNRELNLYPSLQFDWLVDESFKDVPNFQPYIHQVFTVPLRKKNYLTALKKLINIKKLNQAKPYDLIIDAQGLIKSAALLFLLKKIAHKTIGLDFHSARESYASFFYQEKFSIPKNLHAIDRLRLLFSKALNYPITLETHIINSITNSITNPTIDSSPPTWETNPPIKVLFLHGTTWPTKQWPDVYWIQLGKILSQKNMQILLPWYGPEEHTRVLSFQKQIPNSLILPSYSLKEFFNFLKTTPPNLIIAVDTGLTHLAAALNIPMISLFGPTSAEKTGPKGENQTILNADFPCAPCFSKTCLYLKKLGTKTKITPPCFESLNPEIVSQMVNKTVIEKINKI